MPTISVEPPRTPQQMERAIKGLVTGRYEWIGFTSVNAVRAVREKFEEFGLDARAFSGLKVAAVGGVTAHALQEWGIEPDLVPSGEQSAHGLLEDWPPFDDVLDPINRVFLPRADIATDTLVAGLHEIGWEVDDVTAYRTVRAAPPAAPVREAIKSGTFDAVVFTSSSTVRNLVGIAGKPHASTVVACIGPATAKTAEEHGLRVDVLAPEASAGALVEALAEYGAGLRLAALEAGEPVVRPERAEELGPPQGALSPWRSRSSGRAACVRRRRCGGWSPRPGCTRPTWCCRSSSGRAPTEPVPLTSMPGVVQHSLESLRKVAREAVELGLGGIMLFGVPAQRDALGSGADDPDGILNVALRAVREEVGDALVVMADLCLDEFTDHGHCGVLAADGSVDNDATLERYASMALAQAEAGRPRRRAVRDDGRPGRARARRARRGRAHRRRWCWRTRRSTRRRSTGRSARRSSRR